MSSLIVPLNCLAIALPPHHSLVVVHRHWRARLRTTSVEAWEMAAIGTNAYSPGRVAPAGTARYAFRRRRTSGGGRREPPRVADASGRAGGLHLQAQRADRERLGWRVARAR